MNKYNEIQYASKFHNNRFLIPFHDTLTNLQDGKQKLWFGCWHGEETFTFTNASRLALGPIQPTKWVLGLFPLG
jgi:hypothetical protein